MTKRLAFAAAVTALAVVGIRAPARAQVTDTVVGSCVYSWGAVHCVRQYRYGDPGNYGIKSLREPSPEEVAEVREREQRWVARCRPEVRKDRHGVGRYVYAAPGCEYGVGYD